MTSMFQEQISFMIILDIYVYETYSDKYVKV